VPPHFERLVKRLNKQHADFVDYYEKAVRILGADLRSRTRIYQIKKLKNMSPEKGPGSPAWGRVGWPSHVVFLKTARRLTPASAGPSFPCTVLTSSVSMMGLSP
jgi:hypothetical protein